MADEKKSCEGEDILFMGGEVAPGQRACLRHRPDHSIEPGVVADLETLESTDNAELLVMRKEGPVYKVVSSQPLSHSGPAHVASENYRDGWDRIFGGKTPVGQA